MLTLLLSIFQLNFDSQNIRLQPTLHLDTFMLVHTKWDNFRSNFTHQLQVYKLNLVDSQNIRLEPVLHVVKFLLIHTLWDNLRSNFANEVKVEL